MYLECKNPDSHRNVWAEVLEFGEFSVTAIIFFFPECFFYMEHVLPVEK